MNDELLESMAADAEEMGSDTASLQELGNDAWAKNETIVALEAELKERKKALKALLERNIPEAMHEQGLSEFAWEAPNGEKATLGIKTKLFGSLRYAPDLDAAVAYLEASGLTGAVKTVVSVDFAETEREAADTFVESVTHTSGREPVVTRDLNPSTLRSFAERMVKEDPTWEFEKVGCTAMTAAVFLRRK